jgi:hypothetical protein
MHVQRYGGRFAVHVGKRMHQARPITEIWQRNDRRHRSVGVPQLMHLPPIRHQTTYKAADDEKNHAHNPQMCATVCVA